MLAGAGGSTQLCKYGDLGVLSNFENHREWYSSSTWLCYRMSANTARMPLLPLQAEQTSETKERVEMEVGQVQQIRITFDFLFPGRCPCK